MVYIEVICSCMWGGKSEEVARRLKPAKFAGNKILVALPTIDDREERNLGVMLRNPLWLGDYPDLHIKEVSTFKQLRDLLLEIDPDILAFDEVHLLGQWPADFISELRFFEKYKKQNLRIIVSGLDMDSNGKTWEVIGTIMGMANEIRKLHDAVCKICRKPAFMTYKIPKKNTTKEERIKVGGEKDYMPLCWECYLLSTNTQT